MADKPNSDSTTVVPSDIGIPLSVPFEKGSEEEEHYKNRKILIVDDEKGIRKSLRLYLEKIGFQVEEASTGEEALDLLEKDDYFLCLTDISMPGMDGLDLLTHTMNFNREIDVVMITGHLDIDYAIKSIKKGAFDYFKKPFLFEDVRVAIMRVIEKQTLKRKTIELERLRERHRIETKNVAEFMIALARIIDAKSPFTQEHSARVSMFSVLIAEKIGLDIHDIQRIALGAQLHDIGKTGTPDSILNKNGPLTDEEFTIIKQHPVKGAELIHPISSLKDLTDIVRSHHECLDGSGYPDGLKDGEIPLAARIVKIADFWDAITSKRPYRDPMPFEKAVQALRAGFNKEFDPKLAEIMLKNLSESEKQTGTLSS